jgi:hypothetical protein
LTGILGAPAFGGLLLLLTILQYDFLISLHWSPLMPIDWPSGLAIGPYGGWMTAGFIAGGLALILFARGLRILFPKSVVPFLFLTYGFAMFMLVSPTDPTYGGPDPKTFHSILHDSAYVLLGISFVPGMIVLARKFRHLPEWQAYALPTWVAIILIIPSLMIKLVALYVFLLAILGWYELISIRIWQLAHKKG